jgi:sarcosine oxidase subunit gamma
MADVHALRRVALNDAAPDGTLHSGQSLGIRVLLPQARFSLRLREPNAAFVGIAAGFRLDGPINTCASVEGRLSARLGPDEWLLVGPEAEAEPLAAALARDLKDHVHSLVDIGHRSVAIAVEGASAAAIVNAGCPLDLSDAAFPAGSATRTLLGKAGIVLMRIGSDRHFVVEAGRSYAAYVEMFLREAARDVIARA